ncbi:MAG: hypothetical protein KME08_20070 [Aphanothece sp. CMT-3BRIN-NPC111]|jgi:hypothetical protein|nr:hypothetical protein [Aphanothece sp. CMT-3BRIN-NPC111]
MIIKGQIIFKTAFFGIAFETIEVVAPCTQVSKASIELSPTEGTLLEIEIAGTDTFNEAINKAREVASYFAKVLTFDLGIFHDNFHLVEDRLFGEGLLPDGNTQRVISLRGSGGAGGSITVEQKLGDKQLIELKKLLHNKHLPCFYLYEQFHSALQLTDPMSKFMALYNTILSLCNDNQKDVDKNIMLIQPSVSVNAPYRPRKSGIKKTVYTRLRNQVGHVRPGTTIEATSKEMEANLSSFVRITKELISKKY